MIVAYSRAQMAKWLRTRIREAREAEEMTQVDLAEELGVSQPAISAWENGTTEPREEMYDRVLEWLDSVEGTPTRPRSRPGTDDDSDPGELSPAQKKLVAVGWMALNTNELCDLCRHHGLKPTGTTDEKLTRLVKRTLTTWDGFADVLSVSNLKDACDAYDLPLSGSKRELADRLRDFVNRTPLDVLESPDEYAFAPDPPEDGPRAANSDPATQSVKHFSLVSDLTDVVASQPATMQIDTVHVAPPTMLLETTRDNVLTVLRAMKLPRRIRDERDAQNLIYAELAAHFGDDVGAEMAIGGFTYNIIDFDVRKTYGIEVKHVAGLFRKKRGHAHEIERLLGQLVLYRKQYRPENIFVVLAGAIESTQRAILRELQGLIEEQRAVLVHVKTE